MTKYKFSSRYHYIPLEVRVGLRSAINHVNEGATAEVCADLVGQLERSVSVYVSTTSDGTATGKSSKCLGVIPLFSLICNVLHLHHFIALLACILLSHRI